MRLIGEKLNSSIPSVGKAIKEKNIEYLTELATAQEAAGASWLDVNTATSREQEVSDLVWLIEGIQSVVQIPLCIDSPNPEAILAGVKACKKIPMINSINGEDERLEVVLPIVKEFGTEVIALTSDEKGIPENSLDRLKAAEKIVKRMEQYKIPIDKVHFDPLVLPVGVETRNGNVFFESTKLLKDCFPAAHVVSGLSNVSYGLPKRKWLNQAFLLLAMGAGMDAAILDVLDQQSMALLKAANVVLDKDEFCGEYLVAYRKGHLL